MSIEYTEKELMLMLMQKRRERLALKNIKRISEPEDILPLLKNYMNAKQELFIVTTLDGKHKPIKTRVITKGLVNRTLVHPREVYKGAIQDNAVAIIVSHNHPSGSAQPSPDDNEVTDILKLSGRIVGIELLDHIIITKNNYYSYVNEMNPSITISNNDIYKSYNEKLKPVLEQKVEKTLKER